VKKQDHMTTAVCHVTLGARVEREYKGALAPWPPIHILKYSFEKTHLKLLDDATDILGLFSK
jgi:hypothetical protein